MPRGQVDPDELAARLEASTGRGVTDVRQLIGGTSSLTFAANLQTAHEPEPVIVKVAPPGVPPTLNRDVLRQARILELLAGTAGVPVPAVLHRDPGTPPDIPPRFVMSRVPGVSVEPITHPSDSGLPTPSEVRSRELQAAEILAGLHRSTPAELGLDDEPAIELGAEVDRWTKIFSTVPADLAVGAVDVGRALRETLPAPGRAALIHGDFRLGNMICEGERVNALIDWEIWAVGDPRIDLAWWLMSTHPSKQPHALRVAEGMPPDDELIAAYEHAAGTSVTGLGWFDALSRFKAGAMCALIMKYDRLRESHDPVVAAWADDLPVRFVELARECLRAVEAST